MVDVSDLIGVKFTHHGRSIKEGFDCYGLAIEVSKRLGHILEDLWYRTSTDQVFIDNAENMIQLMSDRLAVTNEQFEGNLIVFFENRKMVHIGVILEDDVFIHCDKYGVRILKLSDYFRKDWRIYKWLK